MWKYFTAMYLYVITVPSFLYLNTIVHVMYSCTIPPFIEITSWNLIYIQSNGLTRQLECPSDKIGSHQISVIPHLNFSEKDRRESHKRFIDRMEVFVGLKRIKFLGSSAIG